MTRRSDTSGRRPPRGEVTGWPVERVSGSAAELSTGTGAQLHAAMAGPSCAAARARRRAAGARARQRPGGRRSPTRAAASAGVDVVRRRSGGGAVLLEPGAAVWVDVDRPATIPAGTTTSAGRSTGSARRGWPPSPPRRRRAPCTSGRWCTGAWSDVVCFAGLGPGEVTIDGRKVVGALQRRTRAGARFQCRRGAGAWDRRPPRPACWRCRAREAPWAPRPRRPRRRRAPPPPRRRRRRRVPLGRPRRRRPDLAGRFDLTVRRYVGHDRPSRWHAAGSGGSRALVGRSGTRLGDPGSEVAYGGRKWRTGEAPP